MLNMKQVYFFLAAMFFGTVASAQGLMPAQADKDAKSFNKQAVSSSQIDRDAFWSHDCNADNCSDWVFDNGSDVEGSPWYEIDINFECATAGPSGPYNQWAGGSGDGSAASSMNSTTSANGTLMVDSDLFGADANYDPDEGGKFTAQRGGESLTRGPRARTNFGREFGTMMTDMQKAQQSFVGALGGVFAKGLSPATAGAEAGLRYARGDKTGAALSAIQGLGGGIGFGAGVINALRMMNPKSSAQLIKRTDIDPEKEAMASAAGAGFVTQARDTLSRLGVPQLPDKVPSTRRSSRSKTSHRR